MSLDEDILLYDMDFISRDEGWIAAETGIIFHTIDGGKTWESFQTDDFLTFFAISMDRNGSGIVVGLDGIMYRTTDKGQTWLPGSSISRRALYNVILDGQKGLIVGDAATIYETQDGGESWNEIKAPELMRQYWLHAVAPLAGNKYLVAGARGSVVFIEDSKITQ